jgi:hypothetical protein
MGARLQAADIVVPRACEGSSTKTATDGTLPSGTVPTHKFLPGDGSKQCRNLDMQTRAVAVAVAGVSEKNKHMEKSSVHSTILGNQSKWKSGLSRTFTTSSVSSSELQ